MDFSPDCNVAILLDNIKRNSWYVNEYLPKRNGNCPGMKSSLPTEFDHINYKSFTYEIFNLFDNNSQYEKYDGIIVVIDSLNFKNYMKKIIDMLQVITLKHKSMPIAIIVEHNKFNPHIDFFPTIMSVCKKHLKPNDFHKVFIFQYERNHGEPLCNYLDKNTIHNLYEIVTWFNNKHYIKKYEHNEITPTKTNKLHTMSAKQLMQEFGNKTLPIELFDHYSKLRIMWCSLIKFGFEASINTNSWLCTRLRSYEKINWNYTLTRFWLNVLFGIQDSHKYKSFNDLYSHNHRIHSEELAFDYYDKKTLYSNKTKNSWIAPTKIKYV